MSYTKYPEPNSITQEYMVALRNEALAHCEALYTKEQLVATTLNKEAGNKLYGAIINLHFNGISFEELVGSPNAEAIAKDIKATLLLPITNITSEVAIVPDEPTYQPE